MKYLILILTLFIPYNLIFAQLGLMPNTEVRIDLETDYTTPQTEITALLNDHALAEVVTSIYWRIDGSNAPEFNNQRTIKLTTKTVGQNTTLEVFIETANGRTLSAKRVVEPIYLDIIIEPQTRTPAFYKGRALPTVGSTANLTAVINGNVENSSKYIFNWFLNNTSIGGGALLGKYKVPVVVPLGSYNVVTVSVNTPDGRVIARRNVELPTVNSKLNFYEINSLYGTRQISIQNSLNLIGNSTIIRAEPYYLDINTYNKPEYLEWKVGGVRSLSGNNPYEVTLAKQNVNNNSTRIDFRVGSLTHFLQSADGRFNLNY